MMHSRLIRCAMIVLAAAVSLLPATASACAACFGKSDSPMAKGMNAGIFALLLVITSVLLGVAIFFAFILRRAARLNAMAAEKEAGVVAPLPSSEQPVSQPTH